MTYINDTLTALAGGLTDTRSKFKQSTYTRVTYTDNQLFNAYEGSALVQRVVDMPSNDATRMWREWQADEEQISKLEDVEKQFKIQEHLRDAYQDARLFGDGYIYFDDGTGPEEPIDPERARELRFVVKVDRWQISEGTYDYDPLSEFYNRPAYYDLMGGDTSLLRIHPSRIVHIVGRKRKAYGAATRLGQSVITSMMDDLKGYDAVMANVADMTFEAKIDVFAVDGLMNKVVNPDELQSIMDKYALTALMKSNNGMIVRDMDQEDYQQKTLSFATLPDIIDRFQMAAAGAAQIPRSRLFGVQTGGLGNAGESDQKDYYDTIKSIQENELQPAMLVLDQMIIKTALGGLPDEVHYNWRSLWQIDDKTKQEIGSAISKRWVDLVGAGIVPEELAFDQVVNELTEAGVSPGLERAANDWRDAGGEMNEGDDMGDFDDPDEEGTLTS